jgi:sugar phosphate isomerase/epimerase
MKLVMFTKSLKNVGDLSVDIAGDYIKEMGFDGADLTVRPGGHVLPEEAEKRLPEAVDMLESKGVTVPMITTSITDASQEYAEEIFRTASECQVEFIKLGYWRYGGFGTIKDQIETVHSENLKGIYRLSKEYGVTAGIHIHSGDFLTANPAVVQTLLQDYDPEHLCAYIDPGHMAVEGGLSGWKMGIDLLQEHIRMVAVKDFGWLREEDGTGEPRWRVRLIPLSEGLVPWREVFKYLQKIGFDGPVSLHSEYHDVSLEDLISQTKEDLQYVKAILSEIQCSKPEE